MGKLFVIDGLDGSGKATQAQLLFETLTLQGERARLISFPNYASLSSGPVRMYLGGELSENAQGVNAFAASAMFSVDRYCQFASDFAQFYNDGGVLVCDRYTTSNAIHQCSKLPREQWDEYIDWLFDFEYGKLGIPSPDCVIYLSVHPDISSALLDKRYDGEQQRRDIHEADRHHQLMARQAAEYMCERLDWHRINCDDGKTIRTRQEIAQDVLSGVAKRLG